MRAERRLGECIRAQKETVGLNEGALRRGSDMEPRDARPTLADAGIDKKLSSRAQKLAPPPFSAMNSTRWRSCPRALSTTETIGKSRLGFPAPKVGNAKTGNLYSV